jgi:hypothetical protein
LGHSRRSVHRRGVRHIRKSAPRGKFPARRESSLPGGKVQGIFGGCVNFVVRWLRQLAEIAMDYIQIPYSREQGIFDHLSGQSREFESR